MLFLTAVLTLSFGWKLIDFVPIIPKEGYVVLDVRLRDIVKDVSNLCLGSNGNLTLARDLAEAIGIKMKKLGVKAIVFGTMDTLSRDDSDPLKRFSGSPYITAQVIEYMMEGFANAGIYPILDARGKISPEVVKALISRKLFLPVMVENEEKMKILQAMGYKTAFFSPEGPLYGKEISFNWNSERSLDIEEIRKEILKRSIIILNPLGKGVAINDPFSSAKVLIFSPESWLIDLAKKVEKGELPATGRKSW